MSAFFERALLVLGLSCLGWYGLAAAGAAYKEHEARAAVEQLLATAEAERVLAPAPASELEPRRQPEAETGLELKAPSGPAPPERAVAREPAPAVGGAVRKRELTFASNVVGLLEIPRLRFSTPVLEGDDHATLRGAAGHLPDTPQPWEEGNSAIAAHRDGIFRPLRNILVGDELRVQTRHGEMRYKVSDTHIVVPTDLSVLDSKTPHMLTLITCYPFNYVGAAPKRFIVHAERIDR